MLADVRRSVVDRRAEVGESELGKAEVGDGSSRVIADDEDGEGSEEEERRFRVPATH